MTSILIFVMGWMLGFLQGKSAAGGGQADSLLSQAIDYSTTSLSSSNSNTVRNAAEIVKNGNGWSTIQVFYGSAEHFDDVSTASTLKYDSKNSENENVVWYSQARQDEIVISLLKNKTRGYFVDLAANDATLLSNTYALEKYYDWDGLYIEPNPVYWVNLTQRKCTTVAAVVGAKRMEGMCVCTVDYCVDCGFMHFEICYIVDVL